MKAGAFLRACHPEPTAAVTMLATALAVASGQGLRSSWVAAAFLSGQLSVGWSNDWIDADRDRRSGRDDKPVQRGEITPGELRTAALLAGASCVPLSLAMGPAAGAMHLVAVAAAWSYNAWLKSTWWSWAPYAVAFGLVPSIITLGLAGQPWAPWWASTAGALLGVGAHLANVIPDLADDAATGVRGLPHRLGGPACAATSAVLMLAATSLLAVGPGRPGPLVTAALVLAGAVAGIGLVRGRRAGSRAPFRAVLVLAAVDVALLIARGAALT